MAAESGGTQHARRLGVVGVPTSAGAFAPGVDEGPRALRQAGLLESLEARGVEVQDNGDTSAWRWRPDRERPQAQNLDAVAGIAVEAENRIGAALGGGRTALVLGGDCTVELGTLAALGEGTGLIYFDAHADMNTPEGIWFGALDAMGMAHVLGVDGITPELQEIARLAPEDVMLFGCAPEQTTPGELEVIETLRVERIPMQEVADDPEGAARRAIEGFASRYERVAVHFDLDVVNFTDLPLSETPIFRNWGLTLEQAMRALKVILSSERVRALTVTELNPHHGDEEGRDLGRFVDALVDALAP